MLSRLSERQDSCGRLIASLEVRQPLAAITTKSVSEEALEEIIRRVVEVAQPERIILFGSAARGEMGPNSDVDLLVVKRGKFDQRRLTGDIYVSLHGVGQAVDVVVVTPEQVERHRNTHWLVIAPALRDGREVYHV